MKNNRKSNLQATVLATIAQHGMVRPGDCVGVAVSGGADSVALLRLLLDLRAQLGITLAVLHMNHGLRGDDSDADESFVASLAESFGLPCVVTREKVAQQARLHRWNLEDAGRRLRCEFFAGVVRSAKVARVALAHTADDQAETILARVLRGTGLSGLAGIYPLAGPVIRPLLEVRRHQLRSYLKQIGQAWREDASNTDQRRMRARIRQQLMPQLESNFSSAVAEHLCRLASLARSDQAFWEALIEHVWSRVAQPVSQGFSIAARDLLEPSKWAWERTELSASHSKQNLTAAGLQPDSHLAQQALAQRLVRRMWQQLRESSGELSAEHVRAVLELARCGRSGSAVDLPGGVLVQREFGRLIFRTRQLPANCKAQQTRGPQGYEYRIILPQHGALTISVPEIAERFSLKVIDWTVGRRDTKREVLDADKLGAPLALRGWQPGDAYRPCGRRSVQKLKRMFLARRIAITQRAAWPVLTSQGRPVWTLGLPPALEFSAGTSTRRVLVVEVEGA